MAGRMAQILDQWRLRRVQAYWSSVADAAADTPPFDLRVQRAEARSMRRQIDRLISAADHRLGAPALTAGLPRQPLGTDWAWRGDAWRGPLPKPGSVAAGDRTEISDDLALYHDCPLGEVSVRQVRNRDEGHRAPFGVGIEVFGFRGSFLSLATRLPDTAVDGLKARHLVRIDAVIDAERPLRGFARLNIRHGPNLAQMVSDLPENGRTKIAEFDLAYANLDETRIERAWLDLIFNDVGMTGIMLRDVVVSRRPRAEL
jgi:Family of unknown function (DUF6478)